MIETRPSFAYLLLLGLALAGWCLHDSLRLLPAGMLLGLALGSYALPNRILRPRLFGILLGSALSFAFCHFVLLAGQSPVNVSIYSFGVIQSLTLTLLIMLGAQWVSWRSEHFDWLLFSIGALLMLSGISWQTMQHKPLYILIVLAFVGILLMLRLFPRFKPHHPPPTAGNWRHLKLYYGYMSAVMGLFLTISLISIQTMEYVDRNFSDLLTKFLMGNTDDDWSGFSGHTYLQGSKEIKLSNQIAFTVKTRIPTEYWRGNILTSYRDGHWFPQETLHLPLPAPPLHKNWQLYRLGPGNSGQGELAEVQVENHYHGILFDPAGTGAIEVPQSASLYQNQYQLFRRELHQSRHFYRLYIHRDDRLTAIWDGNTLGENLEIDAPLRRKLLPLAQAVTGDAASGLQRARRIESWFHREFTYSLKVGAVTPGQDPTLDFLLQRKPAYCSWFASGMVLMLRSQGIPAHIVSGWRSMEYNSLAGAWVVREKDAHDWVEVLDTESNLWVRFDPTPPGQLAQITGDGNWHWWRQFADGLGLRMAQIQQALAGMSLQEKLDWLRNTALNLLRQPLFYLALLLLLGLNQLLKLRRRRQGEPAEAPALLYAGADPALRRPLQQLETWLQTRGLSLPRYQTLEIWLPQARQRLSSAEFTLLAEIVVQLQLWRFGPTPGATQANLLDLISRLPALQASRETSDAI